MTNEMDKISINYNNYIGAYVDYEPIKGTSKIAKETSGIDDEEPQIFETEELGWKIWDYNENTNIIRLISDKPTSKGLKLKGAKGYNNGVFAINEICKQCYGNKNVDVSSLKRSDIQKVIKYDYTNYVFKKANQQGEYKYGDSKTYDKNFNYPLIWDYDKEWDYDKDKGALINEKEYNFTSNEVDIGTGSENTTFRQSFWASKYDKSKVEDKDWTNTKYYNLLFKDDEENYLNNYWLSGHSVLLYDDCCGFIFHAIITYNNVFQIDGWNLYFSDGRELESDFALRPVVSINLNTSGYSLEKVENNLENSVSFKLK